LLSIFSIQIKKQSNTIKYPLLNKNYKNSTNKNSDKPFSKHSFKKKLFPSLLTQEHPLPLHSLSSTPYPCSTNGKAFKLTHSTDQTEEIPRLEEINNRQNMNQN